MQRRHFELIADVLRAERSQTAPGSINQKVIERVAERFAGNLTLTNNNFDRDRFLKACGMREEVE